MLLKGRKNALHGEGVQDVVSLADGLVGLHFLRLLLQPSAELNALITVLFGIEDRAKLYYISGGKTGGDKTAPTPTPDGGSEDGGGSSDGGSDVTPVTPEPTPGGGDMPTGGDE